MSAAPEQATDPYRALLVMEFVFTDGPADVEVLRDYILSRVAYDESPPPDSVSVVAGAVADEMMARVAELSTRH
jgi:hypothetical protein